MTLDLTLVLLNCLFLFFIHLKLELLTQFPASNDEKENIFMKMVISQAELFDKLTIYHKVILLSGIVFSMIFARNCIFGPSSISVFSSCE